MYLYVAVFPNNKIYVGITVDIRDRKTTHKSKAKTGWDGYLYNAIRKYGFENIIWNVADGYSDWKKLCVLEKEEIARYKSNDRNFGYNISDGGDGTVGIKHTEEWKKMMSERMSGENSPSWGRRLTDEQKKHLSEINTGEKHPRFGRIPTEKQKIALANGFIKYCEENGHPWAGKNHSAESKRKISEANSGEKNGMYRKRSTSRKLTDVAVIEIRNKYKTGDYSLLELASKFNVGQTTISDIIKNKKYKDIK